MGRIFPRRIGPYVHGTAQMSQAYGTHGPEITTPLLRIESDDSINQRLGLRPRESTVLTQHHHASFVGNVALHETLIGKPLVNDS